MDLRKQYLKKWIKATSKKLDELQGRSLSEMDIRAVFLDGKDFSKYGVIIALGVASSGKKYVLGIYQASGEDHSSCLELLNNLQERGLRRRIYSSSSMEEVA